MFFLNKIVNKPLIYSIALPMILLMRVNIINSSMQSLSEPQLTNQSLEDRPNLILQNYSRVFKHNNHQPRSLDTTDICGGTYRNQQTTIKSPGYPDNYPPNVFCKYSFLSPYACRTQFHIQFLDFAVESAQNCSRDRLEIGQAEVLCGKVIGIMKYKAMDGVLRVIFKSDGVGENRGFHLLVTRLPCASDADDDEGSAVYPVYERVTTTEVSAFVEDDVDSEGSSDMKTTDVTTERDVTISLSKGNDDKVSKPYLELLPPLIQSRIMTQKNSDQYLPPGWGVGYGSGFPTHHHTPNCVHPNQGQPQSPGYPFLPPGNYPLPNNQPPVYYPNANNNPAAIYPPASFPPTNYYPIQGAYPPPNNFPQQPGNYPPSAYYPTTGSYPPAENYPSQGSYPPPGTYPPQGVIPGYLPPSTNPSFADSNPQEPNNYPSTNSIPNPNYPSNPSINSCNPIYNQCQLSTDYAAHRLNPQSTFTPSALDHFRPNHEPTRPIQVETQAQVYPSVITPRCCARTFNQRRFYLSSPDFPSRNTQHNVDCLYFIERNHPGICRLRIEFKFFFVGTYNQQLGCNGASFLEIDGQRVCGCNTGLRYVSQWGQGAKVIRVRSTASVAQNVRGFLLDVVQEECPFRIQNRKEGGRELNNIDRADDVGSAAVQPVRLHSAALEQRNTSSLITYYYYSQDDPVQPPQTFGTKPLESKQQFEHRAESPTSSQFFFLSGNNAADRCSFGYGHWLKLATDPLWQLRPACNRY